MRNRKGKRVRTLSREGGRAGGRIVREEFYSHFCRVSPRVKKIFTKVSKPLFKETSTNGTIPHIGDESWLLSPFVRAAPVPHNLWNVIYSEFGRFCLDCNQANAPSMKPLRHLKRAIRTKDDCAIVASVCWSPAGNCAIRPLNKELRCVSVMSSEHRTRICKKKLISRKKMVSETFDSLRSLLKS